LTSNNRHRQRGGMHAAGRTSPPVTPIRHAVFWPDRPRDHAGLVRQGEGVAMGDGDPRVSVVMITHNRREETLRTLGYLRAMPERPRVIMVDNASTDGTAAAVHARYHPSAVEVLEAGANLGASGRNLGVA